MQRYLTDSAAQTMQVAAQLAKKLRAGDVIAFTGPMGAGKTTFTRGLLQGLDGCDEVSSPTFALVNEYRSGRLPVFHFDLFRIQSLDDLYATGFFDYLDYGGVLVVEWSEQVPALRDELHPITVTLSRTGETGREILIDGDERF